MAARKKACRRLVVHAVQLVSSCDNDWSALMVTVAKSDR
jgi:hypothetical protein